MEAPRITGPLQPGPVHLAEYSQEWPILFDSEKRCIVRVLPDVVESVEHIGSTAVVGLAAKPVIDILLVLTHFAKIDAVAASLESAGYALRVVETGHRMFRNAACDVHVHVWQYQTDIDRHIAFRDRLRACAEDRTRYERCKRELAQHGWKSRDDYARAKSAIIDSILAQAAS